MSSYQLLRFGIVLMAFAIAADSLGVGSPPTGADGACGANDGRDAPPQKGAWSFGADEV